MPFAAALSEHPLVTHAVGEVLDRLGPAPDLALLFVGAPHTGAIKDIAGAVRQLLEPTVLAGCTTGTVGGGNARSRSSRRSRSGRRASGAFAPYRLVPMHTPESTTIAGLPAPRRSTTWTRSSS